MINNHILPTHKSSHKWKMEQPIKKKIFGIFLRYKTYSEKNYKDIYIFKRISWPKMR